MGYFGKIEEKLSAQKLRKQGLSYKEIIQIVKSSKDSISRWCKDIPLTKIQKQRLLQNKQLGQRKGSLIAAENKRLKRIETIRKYKVQGIKDLGILSKRDKFISGIAFYAAEGGKTDRQISFSNSDPKLIKFMMGWFRTYLKVPESRFRGSIWIHDDLDVNKAKLYWSRITGIPLNQFFKNYIVKSIDKNIRIRKNLHAYGVFSIRISDSLKHRKTMGWIFGLLNDKISQEL